MNLDFSADQKQLRDQARRLLADKCPPAAVRRVLDGAAPFDRALWDTLAEMGFTGTAIPEAYGGLGAGYLELCVIAEELGRALAPVPFASSVYLAAEFIGLAGSEAQKRQYLPKLASGALIGTFAFAERAGVVTPDRLEATVARGALTGVKNPVPDGSIADFAVVAAHGPDGAVGLFLVDLTGPGVQRRTVRTIDPTRDHARIRFDGASAEPLGAAGGWDLIEAVLDRAAVLVAFEQIGGADRALEMARDYALDRFAFGRPIGSFQALKHMMADMYVSATLARSNCYWAAWALSSGAGELSEAAATARVSATQAFQLCSKNNIQVHGGMGFTWQFDCHLYYRRSNLLALSLGSLSSWEGKLVDRLRRKNAA